MSIKKNKIIKRNLRLMWVHDQLILLKRNPTNNLERSIGLQRLISKALSFSSETTQFSIIENLATLARRHRTIREIIEEINPDNEAEVNEFEVVSNLIQEAGSVSNLVWDDRAEELMNAMASAFRSLRKNLCMTNLRRSYMLVKWHKVLKASSSVRVDAFGVFNALCDKNIQEALSQNINKILKGDKLVKSVTTKLEAIFKVLNKNINERINYE